MCNLMLLNNISKTGTQLFENSFALTKNINRADIVMVRSAKMHDMETDHLLAIGRAGAGVNNIPVDRCTDEGVVVFNTPGANANAVKELLLLGMLMSARDVLGGTSWAQSLKGNGDEVPSQIEKGKSAFKGTELRGKKVSVIGMGAIGTSAANVCAALGMDAAGYSPSFAGGKRPKKLSVDVEAKSSVEEAVQNADYVVICLPLKADTKGMFNQQFFEIMKDHCVLLNFSRAGLINEDDLEAALSSGKLRKYVTDFATDRTLHMKNTICLPHMGASTKEATDNCAVMAAEQIIDYIKNGNITNSVNYPEISLGEISGKRIVILYGESCETQEKIFNILQKYNLQTILQKHNAKNNYGVTLAEGEHIDDKLVDELSSLGGVTKVRVIS